MNKKTIFVISPDNIISIITNSSSELFILEGDTEDIIKEMISEVYPDYLSEYEEVKEGNTLDNEELESYVSWVHYPWDCYKTRNYSPILGIDPNDLYVDYDKRFESKESYYSPDLSEKGCDLLREKLKGTWLLYSKDENPNWDYQERLSGIAERYHLG